MNELTLTRSVQVLEVLHAGGHVRVFVADKGPIRTNLHAADGSEVRAWLTAINTALRKGGAIKTDGGMTESGAWARWELPTNSAAGAA